jgi:uncharacterized membrane protein YkgB
LCEVAFLSSIDHQQAKKELISEVGCDRNTEKELEMIGTILIVILILALIGALPTWPHSRNWGYYPTGGLGLIIVIVVILLLLGRI